MVFGVWCLVFCDGGAGFGVTGFEAQSSKANRHPGVWGLGLEGVRVRFQVSGCRVQGSGFRFQCSGFRVQDSGFRFQGSGFRVQGSGFRLQVSG